MTVLYIILAVLGVTVVLSLALLFVHAFITLEVDGDVALTVRILCFKFRILPRKEKKYKLKRYTLKKIRARDRRRAKAAARRALRDKEAKERQEREAKMYSDGKEKPAGNTDLVVKLLGELYELLPLICRVIGCFTSRFFGKLHIRLERLRIRVGADDAMQAAVLFGAVNQAVQYFIAFLRRISHVDGLKTADYAIEPDFTTEGIDFRLKLTLRLSLANLLWATLCAAWRFLVGFIKQKSSGTLPSPLPPLPPLVPLPEKPDKRS